MTEQSEVVIRRLESSDVDAAVTVFADSFRDYKPVQELVGTGDAAYPRLRRFMGLGVRLDSRARVIVAERDMRIVGVLTYADAPACSAIDLREVCIMARVAGPRIVRAIRIFAKVDRAHPKTPHRHLQGLGVDPASQSQGIGRALVDEFVRGCDDARSDGYLETIAFTDQSRPSLTRYYERFGFAVSYEASMGDDWSLASMTRPFVDPETGG